MTTRQNTQQHDHRPTHPIEAGASGAMYARCRDCGIAIYQPRQSESDPWLERPDPYADPVSS